MSITRQMIVEECRAWLGTRYHHQGRVKGRGVDCIGLVGGVALALGVAEAQRWIVDRDGMGYAREPDPAMLTMMCERYLERAPAPLAIGDIIVLAIPPDLRRPRHFAFVSALDPVYIVHAYAQARRVVENRFTDDVGRVHATYRFRGLA